MEKFHIQHPILFNLKLFPSSIVYRLILQNAQWNLMNYPITYSELSIRELNLETGKSKTLRTVPISNTQVGQNVLVVFQKERGEPVVAMNGPYQYRFDPKKDTWIQEKRSEFENRPRWLNVPLPCQTRQ